MESKWVEVEWQDFPSYIAMIVALISLAIMFRQTVPDIAPCTNCGGTGVLESRDDGYRLGCPVCKSFGVPLKEFESQ